MFNRLVTLIISALLIYLCIKIPALGNDMAYCIGSLIIILALCICMQIDHAHIISLESSLSVKTKN